MKIVHVVWGMKTGGVETMLVNIINEQVKSADVSLFVINDFIEQSLIEKISPKCKIKFLNRKPGDKNPLKIIKLNYWICRYRPDIIHVHSQNVSKLIFGSWNIVRTVHNTTNVPEEYPRMKALYAISETVADEVKQLGFSNIIIIPNGIAVREIKQKQTTNHPRNYKIVQVGRFNIEQKGQDLVISALAELLKRGVRNFHLYLIGQGRDEDLLRQQIQSLELEDYVTFEGLKTQDYIYNHLCDYDLFVQPSRYEGFGITVAEAMSAKVPVLVSNIEGPMEIIESGKYGMCFECQNISDLAEKLEIILKGGYDYSLIDKAYQHVCDQYDVKVTAQLYLEEYKKVIGK